MSSQTDVYDIRENLRATLMGLYGKGFTYEDEPGLVVLLKFLDTFDSIHDVNAPGTLSPFWKTLHMADEFKMPELFKQTADQLMADAKASAASPRVAKLFEEIYEDPTIPYNIQFNEHLTRPSTQDVQQTSIVEYRGSVEGIGQALLTVWDTLSAGSRKQVVSTARTGAARLGTVVFNENCRSLKLKYPGTLLMAALAPVIIPIQTWKAIQSWRSKSITGKRCAKICVDSASSAGSGFAGLLAGAAAGSMVSPIVGTFVGGIVGGLTVKSIADRVINYLTMRLFDLPKEEAEEAAYKFVGVKHTASNDIVNNAFRLKALKLHPARGGSPEDFHTLKTSMVLIKQARGETEPSNLLL